MSAYQVFCKEYRVTIVADHPGIGKDISHPQLCSVRLYLRNSAVNSASQQAASSYGTKIPQSSCFSPLGSEVTLGSVLVHPSLEEISFLFISLKMRKRDTE